MSVKIGTTSIPVIRVYSSSGSGASNLQSKTVTPSNSNITVTPDSGYDALSSVIVNAMPTATQDIPEITVNSSGLITAKLTQTSGYVPAGEKINTLQLSVQAAKTVTPSSSSQTAVVAGKYTTGAITVAAVPSETGNITENGTFTPSTGHWFSSVTVDVPPNNQDKTVTPSTSQQSVSADAGFTGLGTVTVNAIQTETKSATPSTSAQTITPSTGKYLTSVSISAIQTQSKSATPTTSSQTITPDSGKYLTSVSISAIVTETKTATPSTATQNITPTSGKYLTKVTVNPIPSEYIIPSGSDTVTSNGTYDVAQLEELIVNVPIGDTINNQNKTVTPSTSQQSITADSGYTGLGTVTVNAIQIETKTITPTTSEQDISPSTGKYISRVIVNAIQTETKSATPSTSAQTITPTSGKYLTSVSVAAIQTETKTATPNTTTQNITPTSGKYLTKVTVNPIPSNYIIPSGSDTVTANGTYDVTNLAEFIVNVPLGDTINNQNKSVTPTKSQQTVTADSGYTGLGTVTVAAIPAQYITTSDADAVAADILINKTAYVNSSKITGTMANRGAVNQTLTSQGASYTIPAGYHNGSGKVTVSLTATTLTNSIINGTAYEEASGDYAWRTTVSIPAGYHSAVTLTKDFSTILPAPDTPATASQILIGYEVYNNEGELVTGTMPNNSYSATLTDSTTSVTIPEGYHNGTGTVSHTTVNIPDPTITVDSTGLITASGSWTKGFTTDSSYSNTKQLTTKATTTITPGTSAQTAVAANVYTLGAITVAAIPSQYVDTTGIVRTSSDLTVSGGTVTAPAGYYAEAASKSVATLTLPTTYPTTATSGYTRVATIDRSTSTRYLHIPTGYHSSNEYYQISGVANGTATNSGSASGASATVSTGSNTLTLTKSVSITPTVTAGYIASGTAGNVSISLTTSVTTKAAATITPGTSNQTIAAGTYLTGAQTIMGDADLIDTNIKVGANIFNVAGTFTSDATATAADIVDGETAYVNGSKVTGTLTVQTYYTGHSTPSSSLGTDGDIYLQN